MKKSITKTMLLIMIAMVSIMMVAQIAKAAVANSKHDLSSGSSTSGPKTTGTDQICVFCHTPHFARTGTDVPALWNRSASSATYAMYNSTISGTMDMTVAAQPQGVSAACLSCHDGTVAFDSLINKPGSGIGAPTGWTFSGNGVTNSMMSGASTNLGTSLTNDHPISITYNTTLDTAFNAAVNGKIGALPLYGSGKNQVECASCHNVHDPGTGATAPFLRLSNASSALCLTCHVK